MLVCMISSLATMALLGTLATVQSPPAPRRSPHLFDNVAVPVLQAIGAEAVLAVGLVAADQAGRDSGEAIMLATPLAMSFSTCGIGAASRHYRGSCWHSAIGTAAGLASGVLVYGLVQAFPGLNPFPRGADDSQAFVNAMFSLFFTGAIGIPAGSIAAWHIGKEPLAAGDDVETGAGPPPAAPVARAVPTVPFDHGDRAPWPGSDAKLRFYLPVFAARF